MGCLGHGQGLKSVWGWPQEGEHTGWGVMAGPGGRGKDWGR
jgi:hypothetical protein